MRYFFAALLLIVYAALLIGIPGMILLVLIGTATIGGSGLAQVILLGIAVIIASTALGFLLDNKR